MLSMTNPQTDQKGQYCPINPFPHRKLKRTATEIIRAGDAFVITGKRREPNPELKRCFEGKNGILAARGFLAECETDEELRRAALDQGIDLDDWKQLLDNADADVRAMKGTVCG